MILDSFRERRPFPGQDPWVVPHEGALLLVQSARNNSQIVIKRFLDLDRMHRNQETVIWKPRRKGDHGCQIWAPELHEIAGKWYVYYAASDGQSQHHRMYVLESDHPAGPYREVGKICDPHHDTWAIDLTVLQHDHRLYAVWSGWEAENEGFPQNLYIAPMANPWTICGERRLISSPEHGWEMSVAPINEGPQVTRNPGQGKLFIAYSADASWSQAYKMGLLEWVGGDVTSPGSWKKLPRPIFTGGGHGCFIETGAGHHLVYHRKMSTDPGWADREIRAEPFVWDSDGYPVIGSDPPPGLRRFLAHGPSEAMPVRASSMVGPPLRLADAG
jgi:GH43 family beta-xylosidase